MSELLLEKERTPLPGINELKLDLAISDHTIVERVGKIGQNLTVVGLEGHLRNPENRLFLNVMTDTIVYWLMDTEADPASRIVLNEGGVRGPYSADLPADEILSRYGEQGFIAHFGHTHGIEVVNAEPEDFADLREAAAAVSPTAVLRYAGMRLSRQLFEMGASREDAELSIARSLAATGDALHGGPKNAPRHTLCTYDDFTRDYLRTYDHPFDIRDYKFHLDETVHNMYGSGGSEVNIVSQVVNVWRDRSFIEKLSDYFANGRSPLFVTHKAHVDKIRDEIEKLGQSKNESLIKGYEQVTVSALQKRLAAAKGQELAEQWGRQYRASNAGALARRALG